MEEVVTATMDEVVPATVDEVVPATVDEVVEGAVVPVEVVVEVVAEEEEDKEDVEVVEFAKVAFPRLKHALSRACSAEDISHLKNKSDSEIANKNI